ncbi:protein FAM133-like [Zingiber officinale]|uniref:protein FAM133-like n=1 Tax=Zingiber officinale TaxID=94328 RepID=UPI001C4AD78B|nr:protein FAM133-like [Zingiber officinale]
MGTQILEDSKLNMEATERRVKKKKRRKSAKNLTSSRNFVANGQHYEAAVKLAENENTGRKKKKMMVETEEMSNLDPKREPKPALEEERNKKKKDKEKHKRDPKEVILEISDKRQRNNLGIEEEIGGAKDQNEQIMKKKKKH